MPFTPDPETAENLEHTLRLTLLRWSVAEIAEELGVSPRTVSNYRVILRTMGQLDDRVGGNFTDQSVIDRVVALKREKKTSSAIAEELGVSQRSITRWVARAREQGLLPPGRAPVHPLTPEILSRAESMLKDNSGYAQAALTLGVERKNLARRLPGYALSREESLERARMGQRFNRISTHL
jgi:DNA-binding CsgD family transcriptional regulator